MDHGQALRLINEIELRLAFLGVDLDEPASDATGEAAPPRQAAPRRRQEDRGERAREIRTRRHR